MADARNIAESRESVPEENIRQAIDLCRDLTNEHGRRLLQLMFEVGAERLLEQASDPKAEDSKLFRDASRTIGSSASRVIKNFSRAFKASFDDSGEQVAAPKSSFSVGLSLVDDEALEKEILVKRMSSRAAAENQTKFSKLNRRFCFLQDRRIKPIDSPLSPQSLANQMTQVVDPLEVPEKVKALLFQALEQEFANALGYLYSELNEMMIDLGILPEIKHHVWRAEITTRSRSKASLTKSQRKALEELHRPGDDELKDLLSRVADSAQKTPGVPIDVPQSISGFRREAEQITNLLDDLEASGQSTAGSLLQRLDAMANETQGAKKPEGAVREILQQADHIAENFTQAFARDKDSREAYLAGKVAAPLARLAVDDPSILINEEHALRLAIKEMSSYADYLEASDPAVRSEVLEEFEDLTEGFAILDFEDPENIASFTTNLSRKSALMKLDFKEQVQRLAQFEEGRTRLAKARRSIFVLIKNASVGHPFPEPAVAFLLGKWTSILVHCFLNSETDAGAWRAARSATDKMVTLIPQLAEGVPEARKADLTELLKNVWNQLVKQTRYRGSPADLYVELGLNSGPAAGLSSDERGNLAALIGQESAAWKVISAEDPQLLAVERQLPAAVSPQAAKAYQLWKDRLRPGTWVQIEEGANVLRCRLMKVFGEGERCVFVDGLGRLTHTLNALQVLEQVKQGKLKKMA